MTSSCKWPIDLILLIEHFHSREQQIANYANLLEQKKAFTREKSSTTRTALGHQHGRRFIVSQHHLKRFYTLYFLMKPLVTKFTKMQKLGKNFKVLASYAPPL